jgi:hypothetical protein
VLAVELGLLVSSGSRSEVDASLDGRCRLVLPPGGFLLPDLAPSYVLEVERTGRNPWLVSAATTAATPVGAAPLPGGAVEVLFPSLPPLY